MDINLLKQATTTPKVRANESAGRMMPRSRCVVRIVTCGDTSLPEVRGRGGMAKETEPR